MSAQQQFDFFTRTVWTPEMSEDDEEGSIKGKELRGEGKNIEEPRENAEHPGDDVIPVGEILYV